MEDRVQSNLSGEAGDLSEPDSIIKKILDEIQTEEEKKRAIEADKAAVNLAESTVLLNSISKDTRKKRKHLDYFSPTSSSTSGDTASVGNNSGGGILNPNWSNPQFNDFRLLSNTITNLNKSLMNNVDNNSSTGNNNNNNNNSINQIDENVTEEAILLKVTQIEESISKNITLSNSTDLTIILQNMAIFLNVYCTRGMKFDPKFVKDEFKTLGLSAMSAANLFVIFEKFRKEL